MLGYESGTRSSRFTSAASPREKVAAHQRVGLRPGLVVAFWVSSLMATIKDFPMDTNNKKTADVPHIRLLSRPEVYST
jgi:hypothetical protein